MSAEKSFSISGGTKSSSNSIAHAPLKSCFRSTRPLAAIAGKIISPELNS